MREKSRDRLAQARHSAHVLSSGRRDVRAVARGERCGRATIGRDDERLGGIRRREGDVPVLRVSQVSRHETRRSRTLRFVHLRNTHSYHETNQSEDNEDDI